MVKSINLSQQKLYDTDYNQWLESTVKKLVQQDYSTVDWDNLIEEIIDLSRRQKDKLISLLTKLFEHLLKLNYWESEKNYNANKWKSEIINFRIQIKKLLKQSPSLKPYLEDIFEECYLDARKITSQLTGYNIKVFPVDSPFNLEQVLDENWLPN